MRVSCTLARSHQFQPRGATIRRTARWASIDTTTHEGLMADDHITTHTTPDGQTHTTVVTDTSRSGGGGGWLFGLIALALIGAAVYYFSGMTGSEAAKDNAVAEAARDVGSAAQSVGDAAKDAAEAVKKQ
jgi:hypothetical protein